MISALATRLCGSPDLYQVSQRSPCDSINFITSHDGFTLNDLVSYNAKHNEANGEANRDGNNQNLSWNCGEEGLSTSPRVIALRKRQVRNFATILLLSRGVPMFVAGDEEGARTVTITPTVRITRSRGSTGRVSAGITISSASSKS